jgi:hypothetical protein
MRPQLRARTPDLTLSPTTTTISQKQEGGPPPPPSCAKCGAALADAPKG